MSNSNLIGNLNFGGADTVALAQKYSTPLYVLDENKIRENCRTFKASIDKYYGGKGIVLYASKALSFKEIYRIVNDESMGVDVVSGGEMFTALSAKFPSEKIYFHGNNKTTAELAMALENNIGRIVVDNLTELDILNSLAKANNKKPSILFRIKPGVDAHTHSFVQTGQIDSKFGFALETGEAAEAFRAAIKLSNVNVCGIHCHIGSQILEIEPFCKAAEIMLGFANEMKKETGIAITELNLGGGFGIRYVSDDDPKALDSYMQQVSKVVHEFCSKNDFPLPFICIEPGRAIVGDAGLTLYTVGNVKTIPNCRTYVAIDGGMTDNPRYALYGSQYEMVIANKALQQKTFVATIAGRCCETGDLLAENINIQTPSAGDILAVFATGAYNYSMASNYNRVPRLPIIMLKDGADRIVVKRESYEDLIRNDV